MGRFIRTDGSQVQANFIINAIKRGDDIYIYDSEIIGDFIPVKQIRILANITLLGCIFKGNVKFSNVIFH
ncbi:MAG TPA: hypothetical protein VN455_04835, partial [Methanotrichaceae archaeon]|nr:hypothetical protein [Methanotrichaceae archaeon]